MRKAALIFRSERYFIYFVMAKLAVTYGIDLMVDIFAASDTVVLGSGSVVTQVWGYLGEVIFNMLVLVGLVKGADRVVREMFGM